MIGGIRRGAEAGDERRKDQPDDLASAPQRDAGAARGVGRGAPWQTVLVGGNQGERRRERHLKARIDDGFRRQQQHAERHDRYRAEGQCRPVHHDAGQHDRNHDERALGGNLGSRQQQIERRRGKRGRRRPFLDRASARHRRDQREPGANEKEHDARDHRHVIAGNRQHMREA